MDAQILENKHLKISLLAPAEQHVYSIFSENRLHSSGVLCQLNPNMNTSHWRDEGGTNGRTNP